ncbi:MAG: cytochrome c oxidase subunit II [Chlorobi bacterium]|nr:cytochrome c oxidase subunit II [Chlorobiota bacterium]
MNSPASNFVEGVDFSLWFILGISTFFLVGITAVMIYFVIKYRRSKNPKATNIEGSNLAEITWTVIPTILVLFMFWYGWTGYEPMLKAPEGAIEIEAHGQMWSWWFVYPNGKRSDSLVIPIDKPVKLNLISHDVIHSLYIPAFRVKQDLMPGKDNWMWFEGKRLGSYDIYCAEYCGERHSYMLSKVNVMPEANYEKWFNEKTTAPADEHPGLTVLKTNGCLACHSLDGSKLVGPSFKGLWGKTETVLTDGNERECEVDENYIRESVFEPNKDVVKGFGKGLMISYKETLGEKEIQDIIGYFKTLK